jgi:hypothetical protein
VCYRVEDANEGKRGNNGSLMLPNLNEGRGGEVDEENIHFLNICSAPMGGGGGSLIPRSFSSYLIPSFPFPLKLGRAALLQRVLRGREVRTIFHLGPKFLILRG